MNIRFVRPEDVDALRAIYAQYIPTNVTFEYELPSREEFLRRITEFSACHPYIVLEHEGRIVGYSYAHRLWERAAYQWDVELTVYLSRECTGAGLGGKLCNIVLELLKLQGVHTVYSLLGGPNDPSEKMHQSIGFRHIGTHEKSGYKNGVWADVIWYEKNLLPFDPEPAPIRTIHQLPPEQVQAVMDTFHA